MHPPDALNFFCSSLMNVRTRCSCDTTSAMADVMSAEHGVPSVAESMTALASAHRFPCFRRAGVIRDVGAEGGDRRQGDKGMGVWSECVCGGGGVVNGAHEHMGQV